MFRCRTAWLYGRQGNNFVHTMIRLFRERGKVRVVSDQWGSPTLAGDLPGAILHLVACEANQYGIYHFTNEGRTHWHAFASAIYQLARERGLIDREVRNHFRYDGSVSHTDQAADQFLSLRGRDPEGFQHFNPVLAGGPG